MALRIIHLILAVIMAMIVVGWIYMWFFAERRPPLITHHRDGSSTYCDRWENTCVRSYPTKIDPPKP